MTIRAHVLTFLAAAFVVSAAFAQEVDFETTPTCELAGLVARPPEGWFNVPFASAPRGHLGCQMMRTGEEKELIGILRVRSVTAPARAFRADGDRALIADERKVMKSMNIEVAGKPVWTRENVPLKGEGFREARGEGYTATIPGNEVVQEVHFMTFRSESARYLITLITPARTELPEIYQRNTDDFGKVIRSLTVR